MTNTEHEFAVGQVVRLKSGGPRMTIGHMGGDNERALCRWFDSAGERQHEFYEVCCLEPVEAA